MLILTFRSQAGPGKICEDGCDFHFFRIFGTSFYNILLQNDSCNLQNTDVRQLYQDIILDDVFYSYGVPLLIITQKPCLVYGYYRSQTHERLHSKTCKIEMQSHPLPPILKMMKNLPKSPFPSHIQPPPPPLPKENVNGTDYLDLRIM